MQSYLLPLSNPNTPSSSSSSPKIKTGSTSPTMLIRSDDDLGTATTRILMPSSIEEDMNNETRPFIPRTSSCTENPADSNSKRQKRRRRLSSGNSLLNFSGCLTSDSRRQSFRQDMGRAASDTFLITRITFKLLRYLGGRLQMDNQISCPRLLCFPSFSWFPSRFVGYSYFFSTQIRRGIVYGDQPRNRLDLYLPINIERPKPVVAFITGGAWIIGYKAWGTLLGQQLAERDVIVACIDYRNFPQGTISDMVKDACQGISFVCNNIAEYGGDPNRIYIMGQSAGAHIAACAILDQAIKEASGEKTCWSVSQIKAYFGLSGGYNFYNLVDHFDNRGLYRTIFLSIMEGEESLRRYSPKVMVQDPTNSNAVSLLPPIILFHGTADYSIPSDSSKSFAETLQRLGVEAESILYEGKTHTDLFLQDPMRGGKDNMFEDLVAMIHAGDSEALARDATATPRKRLVPEFMLKLARSVSPF
ncbi:hypothetical protein OROGR_010244 [Orobanche gracilis]